MKEIFQAICAKTPDGEPCCDWMGEDGAGHYVKMVHNGIEYGDMQLICEAYQLMKEGLGMTNEEMNDVLTEWNKGELDSYLIEITRDILAYKDEKGEYVVDKILDTAGQKGTGKWTSVSSLDLGMPLTLIGEAVYARCLSAMKEERVAASKISPAPSSSSMAIARRSSKISARRCWLPRSSPTRRASCCCAKPPRRYQWNLNYGGIALVWRAGCIIRSAFLGKIKEAFDTQSGARQPAARSVLHGRDRALPAFLAPRRGAGGGGGRAGAGLHHRAGLLRRLPQRTPAGQPAAGAARLLRRAHLRAHRPTARQVLPHQLDRQGRQRLAGTYTV